MPLSKAGKKMLRAMKKEYGDKKGTSVFYAKLNSDPALKKKMEGQAHYTKK